MLFSVGTAVDLNCSTGCPTHGCYNSNCPYRFGLTYSSFGNDPFGIDDLKREAAKPMPAWQSELQRTPRRMKRPCPANKPFNSRAHRRSCY